MHINMASEYKTAPIRSTGKEIEYGNLKSPKGNYGSGPGTYQGRIERSIYPIIPKPYQPQAVNYGNPVVPFYRDIKNRTRQNFGDDFFMKEEDDLFRKYVIRSSDQYFSAGKAKSNYLN
jgi:hypothetical protein